MTKEEFEVLQLDLQQSGKSIESYLQEAGVGYSTSKASTAMFCLNDTMRFWLCPGMTDMRKGISSLCGAVRKRMHSEMRKGDVFIFIGQSRRLMKLLHAEDGGMVMYVKRLEAGRFKLPEYDEA